MFEGVLARRPPCETLMQYRSRSTALRTEKCERVVFSRPDLRGIEEVAGVTFQHSRAGSARTRLNADLNNLHDPA